MKKVIFFSLIIIGLMIFIGCGQTGGGGTAVNNNNTTNNNNNTLNNNNTTNTNTNTGGSFIVTSNAFINGGTIPNIYCNTDVSGGLNSSIPLVWSNLPPGTQSLALVMLDISAGNWVHWVVTDIPSTEVGLAAGDSGTSMPLGSVELANELSNSGYDGPEPPIGSGNHSYVTTVYALNVTTLGLSSSSTYSNFLSASAGKVVGQANITGLFSR